ncbi:MAG: hypothetical protein Q9164_000165 [Protoblastenia rupestris]
MANITVEDFADFNNSSPTNSPDSPGHTADLIDHGLEDDEVSVSGSARNSSDPDEAVFDQPSRHSSPRTSNGSDNDMSILESPNTSQRHPSSPPTPPKTRSRFRNPSSVRAMQTDITPPHISIPSSRPRKSLYTPSRQPTPRSLRSQNSAIRCTPSKLSPSKRMKKEYPLVLLHITLLPLPSHYTPSILEEVLPPTILENWTLLREKLTSTVLERGVLIPHPREDYDLLEERLLESLELKQPRILKCGHFHLSAEEAQEIEDKDSGAEDSDTENDADICPDCHRRIRDGSHGDTGTGSRRWDIKIFAANGLMRAGAWGAAWKEMERVDVEVLPWMEEHIKRELDFRREEEQRLKSEQQAQAREEGIGGLDDERLKEIYGQNVNTQDFVDGLVNEDPVQRDAAIRPPKRRRSSSSSSPTASNRQRSSPREEIPLWHLLRNYLYLAAQDRRNLAIFLLSALVLFLTTMGGGFSSKPPAAPPQSLNPLASHDILPTPAVNIASSATETLSNAAIVVENSASSSIPSLASEAKEQEGPAEEPGDAESEAHFWTESAEETASELLSD